MDASSSHVSQGLPSPTTGRGDGRPCDPCEKDELSLPLLASLYHVGPASADRSEGSERILNKHVWISQILDDLGPFHTYFNYT